MLRLINFQLPLSFNEEQLPRYISRKINVAEDKISKVTLVKKSVDARDKGDIHFVVTVDFETVCEEKVLRDDRHHLLEKVRPAAVTVIPHKQFKSRPVVVGEGPAGLFAGLTLAKAGARPIIIERGKNVTQRLQDVQDMFSFGKLDTESNVQFGEGGAGTFSDGKLTTGIKSPYQKSVLETFVEHGAPGEILYEQKPHIGTDLLRNVVESIRNEIISLGGEVRFSTKLTRLIISSGRIAGIEAECTGESAGKRNYEIITDDVLLAIGHSSRDTLPTLLEQGVVMTQKPFAMGVRIEHKQKMINVSQFGGEWNNPHLPVASYKLNVHTPDGRGVYTFCMCPGGQVIAAASEKGCLATNGMSRYLRDGENANSALLVGVSTNDFPSDHPLAGMEMQREIEKKAFEAGGGSYRAPVQLVGDFLQDRKSTSIGEIVPSYLPGYTLCDLRTVLPQFMADDLKFGIERMDRQLKGFASNDAVMTGVESRTSSPVRLNREKNYMSCTISGLYPVGEGAGYAGGIVSAAVDGISAAMAVIEKY